MKQSPVITAVLWMVGALFSFMMMGIGGRELSSELGTFQILFFRSIIGLVVVFNPLIYHQLGTDKNISI